MTKITYTCHKCERLIGYTGGEHFDPQADAGTNFNQFKTYREFVWHMKNIHGEHYASEYQAYSDCNCWIGGWG